MKTFKNSKNEEMFTAQGFIQFAVTQKMVPSCRLLLFHVRDDQETVADNMVIDVEDILENKVLVLIKLVCLIREAINNWIPKWRLGAGDIQELPLLAASS